MSLLTIIADVAKKKNLTAPSTVIGNTNKEIIQLLELAQEEGEDLYQRGRWQRLRNESTFSSVATESQGAITTLAGSDFGWILNDTVWNRTAVRRLSPTDEVEWQQMKATNITGPVEYFVIRGNTFRVIPTMTASQTVAFEWMSVNWCESSGGTGQSAWAADADVGRLPEKIMQMGILWRFNRAKGLDYAEEFNQYEAQVANALARDGAKKRVRTGAPATTRFLTRNSAAEGSWTL